MHSGRLKNHPGTALGMEPQLTDGVDSLSLGLPKSQKVTPSGNSREHLGHLSFKMATSPLRQKGDK